MDSSAPAPPSDPLQPVLDSEQARSQDRIPAEPTPVMEVVEELAKAEAVQQPERGSPGMLEAVEFMPPLLGVEGPLVESGSSAEEGLPQGAVVGEVKQAVDEISAVPTPADVPEELKLLESQEPDIAFTAEAALSVDSHTIVLDSTPLASSPQSVDGPAHSIKPPPSTSMLPPAIPSTSTTSTRTPSSTQPHSKPTPVIPSNVPQDLAMLMEMVQDEITPPPAPQPRAAIPTRLPIKVVGQLEPLLKKEESEDGALSDHEVADLLDVTAEGRGEGMGDDVKPSPPEAGPDESDEDASEDSSDSDEDDSEDSTESESEEEIQRPARGKARPIELDDVDEDGGPSSGPAVTKNEILVPDVHMPDFDEIGAEERIENIGEVMNIVDSVVVVKGRMNAQYQVIDSGSLLVFEDRKVLGYVFETFGAVTHPLYSVRFPSSSSIDKERVYASRAVFHVPDRSNYVFTRHLLLMKGSDASNIHDEEVSDNEVEFSDDEKEAEYKRVKKLKRRRGDSQIPARANWQPGRDDAQEDVRLTYDDSAALDVDPRATRGPPIKYDDEDFGMADAETVHAGPSSPTVRRSPEEGRERDQRSRRGRGDYRGGKGGNWRPPAGDRGHGGRGRGRGRGRGGPSNYDRPQQQQRSGPSSYPPREDYPPPHGHRALSPASEAIARVTGQYDARPGPSQPHHPTQTHPSCGGQDTYDPRAPAMASPVTPTQQYPTMQFPMGGYINPRFAFAPGFYPQMNPAVMYGMQQMQGAAMQGGYGWGGQQQQQQQARTPQQQGVYPPQNGRSYDGEGQYRY